MLNYDAQVLVECARVRMIECVNDLNRSLLGHDNDDDLPLLLTDTFIGVLKPGDQLRRADCYIERQCSLHEVF